VVAASWLAGGDPATPRRPVITIDAAGLRKSIGK
jgi:hypothetical protein